MGKGSTRATTDHASPSGSAMNSEEDKVKGGNVGDCTSCKIIGTGGCFAGAMYALHERSKLPVSNRNRHWLGLIGIGKVTPN